MSVPEIGQELLPNLYVSSITVGQAGVRIEFVVMDFIDNPTWADSDLLKDKIKIKSFLIGYNNEVTDSVAFGTINSLNEGEDSINLLTTEAGVQKTDELSINNPSSHVDNAGFKYYYYTLKTDIPDFIDKANIYLYAMLTIDMTNLNLNYTDYKYLDGPMVSEIVKANNNTPATSFKFVRSDGSIYSGPIHIHESTGKIMEGSFHSDRPHEFLERQPAQNTKNIEI